VIKNKTIAVVGLGYVGLPVAVAFAEKNINVIGFDINEAKINSYKNGIDITEEVGNQRLQKATYLHYSSNPVDIQGADFVIVAVPTPVSDNKTPHLEPIENATRLIGRNIKKGAIIIYESTVYPGFTESFCIPILEKESGMVCGRDFKIGYSPERINPGDHNHRFENIIKVTSGMDDESSALISQLYSLVVDAGIHQAESIKIAEAAKVIENAQRDINIAFVNELALIFDRMNIDTESVLKAAGTKWNFLPFRPGLVGGHCIGIDPYYLSYKAQELGYHPEVILSGRNVNDSIAPFIAHKAVKKMINAGKIIKNAHVLILGLTFKENCPDLRNSKVYDMIKELQDYGITVSVHDPVADHHDARQEYGIDLVDWKKIHDADAIITTVAHDDYKDITPQQLLTCCKKNESSPPVFLDVKSFFDQDDFSSYFDYWRL
jgi:UDP-N-acetyl-D-galactosamine dehydrogenase